MKTSVSVRRIVRQNIAWAVAYNIVAVPFAATGIIGPGLAALGMSVSSLIVVLNAARLTRDTRGREERTTARLEPGRGRYSPGIVSPGDAGAR